MKTAGAKESSSAPASMRPRNFGAQHPAALVSNQLDHIAEKQDQHRKQQQKDQDGEREEKKDQPVAVGMQKRYRVERIERRQNEQEQDHTAGKSRDSPLAMLRLDHNRGQESGIRLINLKPPASQQGQQGQRISQCISVGQSR